MESKQNARGFIKGNKLVMSFHQAGKPTTSSSVAAVQYSSSQSASSVGLYADHPPKQNHAHAHYSSYITCDDLGNSSSFGLVDNLYSYDQSIDARAASYISGVQERFRLERFD
ncbi:hypothetical protein Dsin_030444 [Dipteronia sinensis]|uniref:Uncharacterized protein n=1 Tax=Dipteronia sinensis TaxID=43782 RepID=A0AAD9ZJ54_9ROSI|nr:hypothetical protein Dsin_030444 [Dipteronia sinensis]